MILITGGAGYIGKNIANIMCQSGRKVLVVDNFSNSNPTDLDFIIDKYGSRIIFEELDLRLLENVSIIFNKYKIESVIHCCALKDVNESFNKSNDYIYDNIICLINILKYSVIFKVKSFIFSSSASVYDESLKPISESYFLKPNSPYAFTKFIGENIIREYSESNKDIIFTILRYFNPAGAGLGILGDSGKFSKGFISKLTDKVVSNDINIYLDLFEDGLSGVRDYIHIEDLAFIHKEILLSVKLKPGFYVFNVGSGYGLSSKELIKLVENYCNFNFEVKNRLINTNQIKFSVSDNSLLNKLFNNTLPYKNIESIILDSLSYSNYQKKLS